MATDSSSSVLPHHSLLINSSLSTLSDSLDKIFRIPLLPKVRIAFVLIRSSPTTTFPSNISLIFFCQILHLVSAHLSFSYYYFIFISLKNQRHFLMFAKKYDFSRAVVEMAWIMLRIDYSRLFWLLFGVFSYENHEGKPRI